MRCNRRLLCVKLQSFFMLTTILTSLIVLITVINHRPSILGSVSYNNDLNYKYLRTPGSFLRNYKMNNESYCNFKYNLPGKFSYEKSDIVVSPELEGNSPYRVLYNVVEARDINSTAPVTLATHVTPEFINYISEIVKHWDGAVSIAAFVPDFDADVVTKQLIQICQCLPEMSKVSVHYIFPKTRPPFVKPAPIRQLTCALEQTSALTTYRTSKKLIYPVNVARNVARQASATEYVLVSDVELIPSDKLATKFCDLIAKESVLRRVNPSRVFVVPVFEIEKYEQIPKSKNDLIKLINEEKGLYFHRHICSHCQKFPGLETWIQQESNDDVKPLLVVKREYPFHRWEPIYIGTKNEPFYSEVLSWEGKQDKMTQMLEMCLKGYRFVILDNAFLIHWPGVKRKSTEMKNLNKWRFPYLVKNTRQYNVVINKLASKYRKNPKCKVQ